MKLYAYCALGRIDAYEARSNASDSVRRIDGMFSHVIRRVDLDKAISDGGSGYFTTPERAIESFIARAEAALANHEQHDWREALTTARQRLFEIKNRGLS